MGLPRFIRSAGTFQTFSARSISSHRAPRPSPDRAAVRMMNSRQRAETPGRVCQIGHEGRHAPPRHRRLVDRYCFHLGQRLGRAVHRVFAANVFLALRSIADRGKPLTQALGGFVLLGPDRGQHRQHIARCHLVDRLLPEARHRVAFQGGKPCLAVFLGGVDKLAAVGCHHRFASPRAPPDERPGDT